VVSGKFEFTIGNEKNIVQAGDTMLKKDGITHGCVCLEDGILLDIFSPMREDFI
jgi:quercetin dioxygenase-like cupin family protein